jgi:hypothetical protein
MKYLIELFCISLLLAACGEKDRKAARTELDFNFDWFFARGEIQNAQNLDFDASDWRKIRLPHDWSVEEGFTKENTAGATACLPGGIGWYRKSFKMPAQAKEQITRIQFDGVYSNSTVWLNGVKLGTHPYGYSPFSYDLTKHLNFGEKENVIVVKADRSAYCDCRWYPGSGIYRNVKLVIVNKVHIPQYGLFITTQVVKQEEAEVSLSIDLNNTGDAPKDVKVISTVYNSDNKIVGGKETKMKAGAKSNQNITQKITVANPKLWDTDNPNLYTAKIELKVNMTIVDEYFSTFGIRTIRYDANEGFFLNGKNIKIKGVCLHHDGGLVGAAVPDGVWVRRLKLLKEVGCNAIRTAHNQPSIEFLDLCDKMGFMVQDEAFDEFDYPKDKRKNFKQEIPEDVTKGYTEHFQTCAEGDIKAMVYRDRNHPSIIMWSLGNEIEWSYDRYMASPGYWGKSKVSDTISWFYDKPPLEIEKMKKIFYDLDPGKYELATTAKKLSAWVKEVDTTRPVTANLVVPSVGHFSGYTDALDIVGYSYRREVYEYGHTNYPDKMILGTENFANYGAWYAVKDKKYIPGIFIWTGIGYLGESSWPSHGGGGGLLNLAGFKNPGYYHFKSFWTDEPTLYLTTQTLEKSIYKKSELKNAVEYKEENAWKKMKWSSPEVNEYWNYSAGEIIAIEARTNCERVELFLNDKSLGTRIMSENEDAMLQWCVPFETGMLKAVGKTKDGKELVTEIKTAGKPVGFKVSVDKNYLNADNYDVAHITAELIDEAGNLVKNENVHVTFLIKGDCRRLGVDNGSKYNVEGFNSDKVMTYRGKCLLIIQSNDKSGKVTIEVSAEGLETKTVEIDVK